MFKKALKRTGIVLLLIAAVFLIRFLNGREKDSVQYTQETEKFISNESLKRLEGSGYQKVAENSFLSVELNFADGNVLITDKESGYVWRSAPCRRKSTGKAAMIRGRITCALPSSIITSPILPSWMPITAMYTAVRRKYQYMNWREESASFPFWIPILRWDMI